MVLEKLETRGSVEEPGLPEVLDLHEVYGPQVVPEAPEDSDLEELVDTVHRLSLIHI